MASIVVSGDTSGTVTLQAPAVAGTTVLTLPTTSGTIVTTAGASALTTSGNLTFTGTGNRILGDFTTALPAAIAFQTSVVNGGTAIYALTNGTGIQTNFILYSGNDVTNFSRFNIRHNLTSSTLTNQIGGTGTYVPLTIETGGAERLRITTTGSVGIGKTNPVTQLEVGGPVAIQGGAGFPVTGKGWEVFVEDATSCATQSYNRDTSAWMTSKWWALDHRWQISGAERMRLDSSGRLTIGIAGTTYDLSINTGAQTNSLRILSFNDPTKDFYISNNNGVVSMFAEGINGILRAGTVGNQPFSFFTNNAERIRIDGAGNTFAPFNSTTTSLVVGGNGTNTNLGARLCIRSAIAAGASLNYAININDSTTNVAGGQNLIAWSHNSEDYSAGNVRAAMGATIDAGGVGSLLFRTGGFGSQAERMRITGGGLVAIGTTAPNGSLTISNQITALSGTSNTYGVHIYPTGSGECFVDALTNSSSNSLLSFRSYNNGTYYKASLNQNGGFLVPQSLGLSVTPSTSGVGITFPATQSASSDANTLDDYEEGSWTPTFTTNGTAPTGVTYEIRQGRYTKIGRTVYIRMTIRLSSKGTGGTGDIMITGAPFSPGDYGGYAYQTMPMFYYAAGGISGTITAAFYDTTPIVYIGTPNSATSLVQWSTCSNSETLSFSGVYQVS
jgi:hypothetical protein